MTHKDLLVTTHRQMLGTLAEKPLGQIPFRHQKSRYFSTLELMRSGRAGLSLITYEAFAQESASAGFAGGDLHELVLAGGGLVRLLTLHMTGRKQSIASAMRHVRPDELIECHGSSQTRLIERVEGRMVLVRLARSDADPHETRQYSLDDGRVIHRASGCRNESRREMAMAVLGRMGRRDAAPLLAELATEGSAHIRWQSVRECLALDSATGFAALSKIAADPADALHGPAGALRAQLGEAYPQLLERRKVRCPA